MIVLTHNHIKVLRLLSTDIGSVDYNVEQQPIDVLFSVAKQYPDELLLWVYVDYEEYINTKSLGEIFNHKRIMASFSVSGEYSISKHIGYIEQKPYTNPSRNVSFPTWLMSSDIGGVYSEVLNNIEVYKKRVESFEIALNDIAKQLQPKGLFCYSNPSLLNAINGLKVQKPQRSIGTLFKFVKEHYKFIWLINLFACFVIFEKKWPIIPFFKSFFYKRKQLDIKLDNVPIISNKEIEANSQVDVIIPTIGRKECLYDVLKDFSAQTILPQKIVIVEQNPNRGESSELDYLYSEEWPFKIEHYFIHQTGVCNARNLALSKVQSDWVLLGDDDNRFQADLIENLFKWINKVGASVVTTAYLQPKEVQQYITLGQTDIFGSGNSMLKTKLLKDVKFDMSFEFGYGEDADFGMQLRKSGNDIIFLPQVKITHLKAPIGGFRTKVKQLWDDEKIQPKPSPTIMLFAKKHYNSYQMKGYKYRLFVKHYRKQKIKNPWRYIKMMNAQWNSSDMWSEKLQSKTLSE